MNAVTAFENRKDALYAQIKSSQNMPQAAACASMALEQIASDLAQNEQNDALRQRQQAVMAVAKRLPLSLRAARAEGRLVVEQTEEEKPSLLEKIRRGAMGLGALMLASLAVFEAIDGKILFALFQALGGVLLFGGRIQTAAHTRARAEGVVAADADELLRNVREVCQAVDVCASDLTLLDKTPALISGTADDATLDLLSAMMEARASGREDLAVRALDQADQMLRLMGVEAVSYDAQHRAMFDILPTLKGERTVRPALVKDRQVLRRGVAAVEGGGGA